MTQAVNNYARVLYELSISEDQVKEAASILRENPGPQGIFVNPLVSLREKERVIDRIFPEEIRRFIKVVCKHRKAANLPEIFEAYGEYKRARENVLSAKILCVTPPSDKQLEGMKQFLCGRYKKKDVIFETQSDPSLIGGFVLKAGNYEYDYSLKGRYRQLEQRLIRR